MPQSFVSLNVHIVFSTKGRAAIIDPEWEPRLYEYIGGTVRGKDSVLLAAGGMRDHVHLLCSLGKQLTLAGLVRDIKSNSSKWIHQTFRGRNDFAWQAGYGAFGVSFSNISEVKEYIRNQAQHHRKVSFQEEFLALLRRHNIVFDERYIWD